MAASPSHNFLKGWVSFNCLQHGEAFEDLLQGTIVTSSTNHYIYTFAYLALLYCVLAGTMCVKHPDLCYVMGAFCNHRYERCSTSGMVYRLTLPPLILCVRGSAGFDSPYPNFAALSQLDKSQIHLAFCIF